MANSVDIDKLLRDTLRSVHSLISSQVAEPPTQTVSAGEALMVCDYARQLEDAGKQLRKTAHSILERYQEIAVDHLESAGRDSGRCGVYTYHTTSVIRYRVSDSKRFHDWCIRAGLSVYVVAEALRSNKALESLCADLLATENALPLGVQRWPDVKLVRRRATV